MKIYKREIKSDEIESELIGLDKPIKYEGQDYPYHNLSSRLFEILIYLIYEVEIKAGEYNGEFDKAHLMQAVGESGRDILLTYEGNYNGVVQCKNYKSRLDKGEIAREILKFLLYYLKDRDLITDLNRFTYYLIAPNGFTESGLELLINFNDNIVNEENLRNWTEKVFQKYKSIGDLNYDKIEGDLIDILKTISVKYKTAPDISIKLNAQKDIIAHIFSIQKVIDEDSFRRILNDKIQQKNILEPIDITPRADDEKIPILEKLIMNFVIEYYAVGYPVFINDIIYQLLEIINRYKPGFLERFAPNASVAHQKIISHLFSKKYGKNLFPSIFQKKIEKGEIISEEIPERDIFTYAGDLAYAIYNLYNKDFRQKNILIDDARKKYQHIIQGKHNFYRVNYRSGIFENILNILQKFDVIRFTGPYTGSNCKEMYEIYKIGRLRSFIQRYSLEKLISSLMR